MVEEKKSLMFSDFNFDSSVNEGLEAMGFEKPSPIQEQSIPIILEHKDLIACAQTGTGKTAAFLLPIIHTIKTERTAGTINALIIVPTRELAVQIDQQLQGLSYFADISSLAIYGGGDGLEWGQEKAALTKGIDVVIATPGKIISHLNMGYVKLDGLKFFVLDEADRMLDMGFYEDIMRIHKYLPKQKQSLLFSATMPPNIKKLASSVLHNHEEISLSLSKPAEGVLQCAYMVHDRNKNALIGKLIKGRNLNSIIIFASTKSAVKQLANELQKHTGYSIKAMHSDLEQNVREETLTAFKNRDFEVLVATDILSRGIDIEKIDLIINYNVPQDAEDYVHRVGRTARAKSTGLAITLINKDEIRSFIKIEKLIENTIIKVPNPEGIEAGPKYTLPESKGKKGGYKSKPKGKGGKFKSKGGKKSPMN